jgi:hypothetical protein
MVPFVVATVVCAVVTPPLRLTRDELLTVTIAVTLARLARVELTETAGERLVEHVPKRGGSRNHHRYVRCREASHGISSHTAHDNRVELRARELRHRAALAVDVVLIVVADNLNLGSFGIEKAEIRRAAEVAEHLGLDPLISPRRYAYAHLLHPF